MPTAFVLGAGLGTRLRPLTNHCPKPLIPVGGHPLITWAFRHLAGELGIDRLVVNTHHLAGEFTKVFPDGEWNGMPVHFRHEPTLLDTGGGLANVRDLLPPGESIALYNGDILCDAPLAPLAEVHAFSGADVTLVLRPSGQLCNVVCAPDALLAGGHAHGPILDIRNLRGIDGPRFQFSGIALLGPRYLDSLPPAGEIFSLMPHLVKGISEGLGIRGVIIPEGIWSDLGTHESLAEAEETVREGGFPRYTGGNHDLKGK